MSSRHSHPDIIPAPGYLLTIPFVPTDETFKGVRQEAGADQKSVVVAVGESVEDGNGIMRHCDVKPNAVIIHAATNKDFEIDFTLYRFVHFSEIHAIWKGAHAAE